MYTLPDLFGCYLRDLILLYACILSVSLEKATTKLEFLSLFFHLLCLEKPVLSWCSFLGMDKIRGMTGKWKCKIPHRMYSTTLKFLLKPRLLGKRKGAFSYLILEPGWHGPLSHLQTFYLPMVFLDSNKRKWSWKKLDVFWGLIFPLFEYPTLIQTLLCYLVFKQENCYFLSSKTFPVLWGIFICKGYVHSFSDPCPPHTWHCYKTVPQVAI